MRLCLQPTANNTNNTLQKQEPNICKNHATKMSQDPSQKPIPKMLQENVSKSDCWNYENSYRIYQNRAQSLSDSPPDLVPKLKRGPKAVKARPGTSKESLGESEFGRQVPKSLQTESGSFESIALKT